LSAYSYIPLLSEQNISRCLGLNQPRFAQLLGPSKNGLFVPIYQLVVRFFVTVSIINFFPYSKMVISCL
jgi:hypothetical protein